MTTGIELEKIADIKPDVLERLRALNIGSVEMLLAYTTAMGDDLTEFSLALGITENKLKILIESAKSLVPQDALDKLMTQPPMEDMPYGARDPKEVDD